MVAKTNITTTKYAYNDTYFRILSIPEATFQGGAFKFGAVWELILINISSGFYDVVQGFTMYAKL